MSLIWRLLNMLVKRYSLYCSSYSSWKPRVPSKLQNMPLQRPVEGRVLKKQLNGSTDWRIWFALLPSSTPQLITRHMRVLSFFA